MITIWKFPLAVTDDQTVSMPEGARVLTVQVQYETPCLWAMVDTEKPLVDHLIHIAGTGHPLPLQNVGWGQYVGSFQRLGGSLVFHVFDIERYPASSSPV